MSKNEDRQQTLEGDVQVGGKKISAVLDGQEAEDLEILGWTAIFTIGNDFVVDREWLETRAGELGIPQHLLPSSTSEKRAFGRAMNRLCAEPRSWDEHSDVEVSVHKEDHKEYHLEVTDRRDGDVTTAKVGAFYWDTDLDPSGMRAQRGHPERDRESEVSVVKGSEFYELFGDYLTAAGEEKRLMEQSNLGEDVRTMIRSYFTRKSNSVKLRDGGAVYFAPITTEEVVQAMKTLVDDINIEWKDEGFRARLDTIEVINTEEKRDMVEAQVQTRVEKQVGKALEKAFEELDEETMVNEVTESVEERLNKVEDFAAEYNALLDVEIRVEEVLEDWKQGVTDEQEELLEKVSEEVSDV